MEAFVRFCTDALDAEPPAMRQYVLQGLLVLSLGGDALEVGTEGGPVLSTVRACLSAFEAGCRRLMFQCVFRSG